MHYDPRLTPPLFEVGLKGYVFGDAAVRLAIEVDRIAAEFEVSVVFDPQHVDIRAVAGATKHLFVFAQHMDPVAVGRGNGAVLPEALKAAGAAGTLLNHSERPMTLSAISRAIRRADEVGLATMVCADSPEEAAAIAQLAPNVVLAEPPELIGGDRSPASEMRAFVEQTIDLVGRINPGIIVMCAAGVKTADDVAAMVALGVGATGCTSGIVSAADPVAQARAMIAAMRQAWDRAHPSG